MHTYTTLTLLHGCPSRPQIHPTPPPATPLPQPHPYMAQHPTHGHPHPLTKGPTHSHVNSGARLFAFITKARGSLPLSSRDKLAKSAGKGFGKLFDELLTTEERTRFFDSVVPVMGDMVLRLPALLEGHYGECDGVVGEGLRTGLRLLEKEQAGIVFLSHELIAALLACSFFCLYPTANRKAKHMRPMNFDQIFASIHDSYHENQESKIKCIIHYFERICSCKPSGFVSFERKVFSQEHKPGVVTYPCPDLWANSAITLCQFKIFHSGKIEHHAGPGLAVDFADEYLGGLIMTKGCVQEEIRFMMNPELIAGMIFLPSMLENEAIEIVGAERFSSYTGYSASFRYTGDHVDRREVDSKGRRMSRIVAIDALRKAGTRQYSDKFLLREVNKAFCGFLDHPQYLKYQLHNSDCGVATGNWGCGIFGGDPQLKSMIQWVAASEASRPSVSYYTFGMEKVRSLDQVHEWIVSQKWTVGDLWKSFADYCSKRAKGETKLGYSSWLIPSIVQTSNQGTKRKKSTTTGSGGKRRK